MERERVSLNIYKELKPQETRNQDLYYLITETIHNKIRHITGSKVNFHFILILKKNWLDLQ